jgi:undecaprenyl-diphosphatase
MRFAKLRERLASLAGLYALELAIAALALVAFAWLARDVFEGELQSLNVAVLRGLHAHSTRGLDALAVGLSRLGGPLGTTVVVSLVVLVFCIRRRFLDAAVFLLTLLGGVLLSVVLKQVFREPRPDLFVSIAPETGYGFPSAHALVSVCLYGHLAALLVLDGPRKAWRWACAAALVLVALGICSSRIYLGVHWLSDVVAGGLVAVFWIASCLWVRRLARSLLAKRLGGPDRHGPHVDEPSPNPA